MNIQLDRGVEMAFEEFQKQFMNEVANKNVKIEKHPDDENVWALSYTDRCVFEENWNFITRVCRDLVVDVRRKAVLARGFLKFFNHQQMMKMGIPLPQLPFEATDKMDGIQAVSFQLNGETQFAADDSFVSPAAKIAKIMWDQLSSAEKQAAAETYTLVFEVIHPETAVVVPYDIQGLALVGAVERQTLRDLPYSELAALAVQLGVSVPLRYNFASLEQAVSQAESFDHTREGFVLRYDNGERVKVKSPRYVEVFRITHNMSEKQKVKAWSDGELHALILKLPEEFRADFIKLNGNLDALLEKAAVQALADFEKAPKGNRKDFALWIQDNGVEYSPTLFKLMSGWSIEGASPLLKQLIYKKMYEKQN